MGRQGPAKKLVPKRPSSSLLSMAHIIPLFLQFTSCALIQLGALIYLHNQNWFNENYWNFAQTSNETVCSLSNTEFIENVVTWENTVVFLVSCYQYLILGVIYSKGLPYREPLHRNCRHSS